MNISPDSLKQVREAFIRADIASMTNTIKTGIQEANRKYENTYRHDILYMKSEQVIDEVKNIFTDAGFKVFINDQSKHMYISW